MSGQQLEYIERVNNFLFGRKIKKVFYRELVYPTGDEYWNLSENIHSIDMNIIFLLDNDMFVQIFWDNEFYCYGLGLEVIHNFISTETLKTIEVSVNRNWQNRIDSEIKNININWSRFSVDVPLTWEIEFNNDTKIWISAFEIRSNTDVYSFADHITVFFKYTDIDKYYLMESNR